MEPLYYSIAEYAAAFIVVFLILFLGISYLFSKEKFPQFIINLLKVFSSIFYGPFLKIKKIIFEISNFGEAELFRNNAQYLLKKIILILETLLIIGAVAIFTSGLIVGWESFLPPKYLREAENQLEQAIDETKSKLSEVNSRIENLENDWQQNKQKVIINAKKSLNNQITELKSSNNSLESQIPTDENSKTAFNNIKQYLQDNNGISEETEINSVGSNAINYIEQNYYIGNDSREKLKSYIDNWQNIKIMTWKLENLTENQIREDYQPNYAESRNEADSYQSSMDMLSAQIKNVREQMDYNFGALMKAILISLTTIIVFIWIAGTVIELLNLNVDLATNVNRIRELKEEPLLNFKDSENV